MRNVAATVVLLVAAVSGCSSGDAVPAQVQPLASASASASGEATVSPSPSTMVSDSSVAEQAPGASLSAAVQSASPEKASDFARHYMRLVNAAFAAADASAVRAVSDPACQGCLNLMAAIEEPNAAGERVQGGDFVIEFAEARPIAPGDALVDIRYRVDPIVVLAADGGVIERRPGTAAVDGQLRITMQDGSWIVRGFRNTPS